MLSIIIPLYNNEKNIIRCLDSIISQTYKDFEIVIINDGSTDESLHMCFEYIKSHENIVIKTIENSGSATARNIGLDLISGDYVYFIDSDDYIDKNYISNMMKYMETEKYSFISSSYTQVKNNVMIEEQTNFKEGEYSRNQLENIFYPSLICDSSLDSNVPKTLWNKIFKREFINNNNLRFKKELLMSQDVVFTTEAYLRCDNFYYLPSNKGYYYVDNPNSRTHRFLPNCSKIMRQNYYIIESIVEKLNIREQFNQQLDYLYLRNTMTTIANIGKKNRPGLKECHKIIKEIVNDEYLEDVISRIDVSRLSKTRKILLYSLKHKLSYVIIGLVLINESR